MTSNHSVSRLLPHGYKAFDSTVFGRVVEVDLGRDEVRAPGERATGGSDDFADAFLLRGLRSGAEAKVPGVAHSREWRGGM